MKRSLLLALPFVLSAASATVARPNVVMILAEPTTDAERAEYAKHGALIGGIDYQAVDFERAYPDALAAGFTQISAPAVDSRTGFATAVLREPSGNLVQLREVFAPSA